jgi:hypothetical protein
MPIAQVPPRAGIGRFGELDCLFKAPLALKADMRSPKTMISVIC